MTWLPLSKEGKFHRMRDGMLYHDAPEYYTEPFFLTAGECRACLTPSGMCREGARRVRVWLHRMHDGMLRHDAPACYTQPRFLMAGKLTTTLARA